MIRFKSKTRVGGRALRWYQYRLRTVFFFMLLANIGATLAAEKRLEFPENGGQTARPRAKTKYRNFPKTVDKQTVDKRQAGPWN